MCSKTTPKTTGKTTPKQRGKLLENESKYHFKKNRKSSPQHLTTLQNQPENNRKLIEPLPRKDAETAQSEPAPKDIEANVERNANACAKDASETRANRARTCIKNRLNKTNGHALESEPLRPARAESRTTNPFVKRSGRAVAETNPI